MMRLKRTETQEADAVVTEDNDRGDGNKKEREGEAKRNYIWMEKTEPYLCSISEISNFASRG